MQHRKKASGRKVKGWNLFALYIWRSKGIRASFASVAKYMEVLAKLLVLPTESSFAYNTV